MPDLEKLSQITMLAELLASMPSQQPNGPRIPFGIPAKRVQWATELVNDYGVRVHPDLAAKQLVAVETKTNGNGNPVSLSPSFTPRRAIDKIDSKFLLDLLRSAESVPGIKRLADELDRVLGDPAAETELLARIAREQPDIIATAKHLIETTPPEAYEQQ